MEYYNNVIKLTNKVRSHLQDDLSRKIYDCRVMNALTYDYRYITDITKDGVDLFSKLQEMLEPYIDKCDLILDGAGYYGKSIEASFPDIKWKCVSDRSLKNAEDWDIPLLSRTDAANNYPKAVFVISSMLYGNEIENELKQLGVNNIINFGKYLSKYSEVNPI